MAIAVFSKHVALLLVAVLIIGTCSAHSSGGHGRRGKKGGSGRRGGYNDGYDNGYGYGQSNFQGYDRCIGPGSFPCYGEGYNAQCYSYAQACDGHNDCPYGDDEYICNNVIRPTSTVFRTRTSTRTTTTTSTSTLQTTSSTSTTTTTTFTSTSIHVTTKTLSAVVPYKAVSSTLTTAFTTSTEYAILVPLAAGDAIAAGVIFCNNLQANAAAVAIAGVVSAVMVTPTVSFTATAHVSCMQSTTSYLH